MMKHSGFEQQMQKHHIHHQSHSKLNAAGTEQIPEARAVNIIQCPALIEDGAKDHRGQHGQNKAGQRNLLGKHPAEQATAEAVEEAAETELYAAEDAASAAAEEAADAE